MKQAAWAIAQAVIVAVVAGCGDPHQRLNAPPQGAGTGPQPDWGKSYAHHNDQGMLADMSIADIHFVPHSAELSGVGRARLQRYAELLKDHGGTLNYETQMGDDNGLVGARLATAREYLEDLECTGAHDIQVVLGGAGGRGMTGKEAQTGHDVAKQAEARKNAYRLKKYMSDSK